MKIVKTMSNFCIKNISLAVMMKKIMELSANSNCIFFFFFQGQGSRMIRDTKSKTKQKNVINY